MYKPSAADQVSEDDHDRVFGSTFSVYNSEELEEFKAPLQQRITLNKLDSASLFRGKTVLDAGCGGGRGSLLALENGASRLVCLDVSAQNVETTGKVLSKAGYSNFEIVQSSLEELPFEDEFFDFVWCNGVLMHTKNPAATLREIIRVLRVGGESWIYVYGAGGIYWRLMATFRRTFAELDPETIIEVLSKSGLPTGRIAEMLDDWKAPFLRAYTNELFSAALQELDCASSRLMRGMDYDTSEHLVRGGSPEMLGNGDLRYMVTRKSKDLDTLSEATGTELNGSHIVEVEASKVHSDHDLEARLNWVLLKFENTYASSPIDGVNKAYEAICTPDFFGFNRSFELQYRGRFY